MSSDDEVFHPSTTSPPSSHHHHSQHASFSSSTHDLSRTAKSSSKAPRNGAAGRPTDAASTGAGADAPPSTQDEQSHARFPLFSLDNFLAVSSSAASDAGELWSAPGRDSPPGSPGSPGAGSSDGSDSLGAGLLAPSVTARVATAGRGAGHHLTAIATSNQYLVLRLQLAGSQVPILRLMPWFSEADNAIVALSLSPQADWLLAATRDGSAYIIPVLSILTQVNPGVGNNGAVNPERGVRDRGVRLDVAPALEDGETKIPSLATMTRNLLSDLTGVTVPRTSVGASLLFPSTTTSVPSQLSMRQASPLNVMEALNAAAYASSVASVPRVQEMEESAIASLTLVTNSPRLGKQRKSGPRGASLSKSAFPQPQLSRSSSAESVSSTRLPSLPTHKTIGPLFDISRIRGKVARDSDAASTVLDASKDTSSLSSCVWWQAFDGRQFAILATLSGKLYFINLHSRAHVSIKIKSTVRNIEVLTQFVSADDGAVKLPPQAGEERQALGLSQTLLIHTLDDAHYLMPLETRASAAGGDASAAAPSSSSPSSSPSSRGPVFDVFFDHSSSKRFRPVLIKHFAHPSRLRVQTFRGNHVIGVYNPTWNTLAMYRPTSLLQTAAADQVEPLPGGLFRVPPSRAIVYTERFIFLVRSTMLLVVSTRLARIDSRVCGLRPASSNVVGRGRVQADPDSDPRLQSAIVQPLELPAGNRSWGLCVNAHDLVAAGLSDYARYVGAAELTGFGAQDEAQASNDTDGMLRSLLNPWHVGPLLWLSSGIYELRWKRETAALFSSLCQAEEDTPYSPFDADLWRLGSILSDSLLPWYEQAALCAFAKGQYARALALFKRAETPSYFLVAAFLTADQVPTVIRLLQDVLETAERDGAVQIPQSRGLAAAAAASMSRRHSRPIMQQMLRSRNNSSTSSVGSLVDSFVMLPEMTADEDEQDLRRFRYSSRAVSMMGKRGRLGSARFASVFASRQPPLSFEHREQLSDLLLDLYVQVVSRARMASKYSEMLRGEAEQDAFLSSSFPASWSASVLAESSLRQGVEEVDEDEAEEQPQHNLTFERYLAGLEDEFFTFLSTNPYFSIGYALERLLSCPFAVFAASNSSYEALVADRDNWNTNALLRIAHARDCMREMLAQLAARGAFSLDATDFGFLVARGYAPLLLETGAGGALFRALPAWQQLEVLLLQVISRVGGLAQPPLDQLSGRRKSEEELLDEELQREKAAGTGKGKGKASAYEEALPLLRVLEGVLPRLDASGLMRLAIFLDPARSDTPMSVWEHSPPDASYPSVWDSMLMELFLECMVRKRVQSDEEPFGQAVLLAALTRYFGVYRRFHVVQVCQDSGNYEAARVVYEMAGHFGDAYECLLEELRAEFGVGKAKEDDAVDSEEAARFRARVSEALQHHLIDVRHIPERARLLQLTFALWEGYFAGQHAQSRRSPVQMLEFLLLDENVLYVVGSPLVYLVQQEGAEERLPEFSARLFLAASKQHIVSSGADGIEAASAHRNAEAARVFAQNEQLWSEMEANLSEYMEQNSYIEFKTGDKSNVGQAIFFTCGHHFELRHFRNVVLPSMTRRLSTPVSAALVVCEYRQQQGAVNASCPNCLVRAVELEDARQTSTLAAHEAKILSQSEDAGVDEFLDATFVVDDEMEEDEMEETWGI